MLLGLNTSPEREANSQQNDERRPCRDAFEGAGRCVRAICVGARVRLLQRNSEFNAQSGGHAIRNRWPSWAQ